MWLSVTCGFPLCQLKAQLSPVSMHLVQSLLNGPLSAGMLTDLLNSLFTTGQTCLHATCHTYYGRCWFASANFQTTTAQQATGSYGTSKNLAKPQDTTTIYQQSLLVMLVLTSCNMVHLLQYMSVMPAFP